MIRLFPDEVILYRSGDGAVTLTSCRLSYEYEGWGNQCRQAILLEQIICCDTYRRKDMASLLLAAGAAVAAVLVAFDEKIYLSAILGLVALAFGLLHLLSRRNVIIIYSPGTQLRIDAGKMDKAQIAELITRIDEARHIRQQYMVKQGIGI